MTRVTWNAQHVALRNTVLAELSALSSRKIYLPVDVFTKMAQKHIRDFEYNNTTKIKLRELLSEVDVRATLGKYVATFEILKPDYVPKDQWPSIIENGVNSIISYMQERSATEHGLTRDGLRAYLPVWPDCAAFNEQLQNAIRSKGYTLNITRTRACVRKIAVPTGEVPTMRVHNGISLFDILVRPTLTHKRRWLKGFTHALSSDEAVVMLDTRIADENGELLPACVITHGDVVLVNRSAHEIIMRCAQKQNTQITVRTL